MLFKSVYYTTTGGRKPVEEFILKQDAKARGKIARNLIYLEEHGYLLMRPYAAKITDRLYELRVECGPNNYRILYFFYTGNYIVLVHVFKKKTDKLKRTDIETAEQRMKNFEDRIKTGEIRL